MSNSKPEDLRIAWVLPVTWFYWQPALSEFAKHFPQTQIFTALWPGFAKGYEDSLDINVIGKFKVLELAPKTEGYGSAFTYLSPEIVKPLLKFKPKIIFTSSFGVWTILVLLLKPLGGWKVVIGYEGSSPGVDFRNSPPRLAVRRLMVRLADAYITNSKAGAAYLTEILGANPNKVFCQPYEVPAPESLLIDLDPDKIPKLDVKRPCFLFVGRIVPRKGLRSLLQACALLKQQGCENYTLLVVGDGEERAELEAFSQEQGLANCVQWLGKVDYDLISAYFQTADVFVSPTWEDTWGVVVLEAMLFGKPVLCSSGAGTSELIVAGENGYVFNPQQPDKLASLMRQLIEQPQLCAQMGDRSREIMASQSPQAAAQFLIKVTEFLMS
jgi:glycosyltransferase involved in cell wall biosynthesis